MFTLRKGADGRYGCRGKYNPNEERWEDSANSPHEGFGGLWPMAWPEVGGGGDLSLEASATRIEQGISATSCFTH